MEESVQPDPRPCYLCGEPLAGSVTDPDHVPPKQFIPRRYRGRQVLLTIEVHKACNGSYEKDEAYFVHHVGPTAHGTRGGNALFDDNILNGLQRPVYGPRIRDHVLREFTNKPGEIWLPDGMIAKKFDPDRVYRVLWKIIRGLQFHRDGTILPVHHFVKWWLWTEKAPPRPDEIGPLLASGVHEPIHEDIFQYWRLDHPIEGVMYHAWLLLLWNAVMWLGIFHDPGCGCETCKTSKPNT